jgi:hypothetical protein
LLASESLNGAPRPAFPGGSSLASASGGGPATDLRSGSVPVSNITSVPEPAAMGLLAILCAILVVSGCPRVAKPAAQLK